jgi:hypothetical protein
MHAMFYTPGTATDAVVDAIHALDGVTADMFREGGANVPDGIVIIDTADGRRVIVTIADGMTPDLTTYAVEAECTLVCTLPRGGDWLARTLDNRPENTQSALLTALRAEGFNADVVGTGGGCEAIQVRHANRPGVEILITDGEAALPITAGEYQHEVYVGQYTLDDRENGTTDRDAELLWFSASEVKAHTAAELTSIIVRVLVKWTHVHVYDATVNAHMCRECGTHADFCESNGDAGTYVPNLSCDECGATAGMPCSAGCGSDEATRVTGEPVAAEPTRGKHDGLCGTYGCPNVARWIPIHKGNTQGSAAPYHCTDCCDRMPMDGVTYPHRGSNGRDLSWACCTSTIGPICQHRAV